MVLFFMDSFLAESLFDIDAGRVLLLPCLISFPQSVPEVLRFESWRVILCSVKTGRKGGWMYLDKTSPGDAEEFVEDHGDV